MKCHSLRDAIVDLARGGDAGPGTLAAIESHLDCCASCAALMARERQLSRGLRALAAAAAADAPSAALERRLLEMFAERQAPSSLVVRPTNWWARAAAAALVVGVSAGWWWAAGSVPGTGPGTRITQPQAVVAGTQKPELAPTPTAALTPVANSRPTLPVAASGRSRGPRRRAVPAPPIVRATGFVSIPGADGLPDFESGQIIRVEIPFASLPTYGIDILPEAQGSPVEADLLVGQDGQARAIRLVQAGAR
jgi:hypothetical protein